MVTKEGLVTFNLLCKDKELQEKVFANIREVTKANKYLIEGEEDVNRVIHMQRG